MVNTCCRAAGWLSFGSFLVISSLFTFMFVEYDYEHNLEFSNSFQKVNATIINTTILDNSIECSCVKAICLPCSKYKVEICLNFSDTFNRIHKQLLYKKVPQEIQDYDDAELWTAQKYPTGTVIPSYYNDMDSKNLYWSKSNYDTSSVKIRLLISIIAIMVILIIGFLSLIKGMFLLIKICHETNEEENQYLPVNTYV